LSGDDNDNDNDNDNETVLRVVTMPGVVTKKAVLTNGFQLYRMGGLKLIVATLRAKPGTPFMTVYAQFIWSK
jgi:hypothetical protein